MTEAERALPLFPLEQVVLFPGMSLPLHIFEERYKVMIGACQVTDQLFGVLLIKSGSEVGAPAQPERVGCTARMLRVDRLPDGRSAAAVALEAVRAALAKGTLDISRVEAALERVRALRSRLN